MRIPPVRPRIIDSIQRVELGSLAGVSLSFTDASPLPDGRILFVAAAEDTKSAYDDGAVAGSAIGVMTEDGQIERLQPVSPPGLKLEGVHATLNQDGSIDVVMVTDADDPSRPAEMYQATLAAPRTDC